MTLVAAKSVSDHVEDLADGRQVAPGEIIEGVETKEPHNQRLFGEGRLLRLSPKQADEVEDDHEVIPPPAPTSNDDADNKSGGKKGGGK